MDLKTELLKCLIIFFASGLLGATAYLMIGLIIHAIK